MGKRRTLKSLVDPQPEPPLGKLDEIIEIDGEKWRIDDFVIKRPDNVDNEWYWLIHLEKLD